MSYRHLDTLSAFTANLDFSSAAASRTMTATAASGTSRFVSECDDSVGDLLAQTFSCAVAIRTIPVASRVTIEASMVGHTAPPKSFGDFDLVKSTAVAVARCLRKIASRKYPSRHTVRSPIDGDRCTPVTGITNSLIWRSRLRRSIHPVLLGGGRDRSRSHGNQARGANALHALCG
jgi:hypothetical protein